jgi:hypothetical protein
MSVMTEYLRPWKLLICLLAAACGHTPDREACAVIEGEHSSLHARVLYNMIDQMTPRMRTAAKSFESKQCGEHKGTIYYYEYASEDAAKAAQEDIGVHLWGRDGRSAVHPDIVERNDKVVAVVSARNPELFQGHVRRPQ